MLGTNINEFAPEPPRYYRIFQTLSESGAISPQKLSSLESTSVFIGLPMKFLGSSFLTRSQSFELLRRAKLYLASRSVEDFDSLLGLDWRRSWNRDNYAVKNLLDLFPSLKFSYESMLPFTARCSKHKVSLPKVSLPLESRLPNRVVFDKNFNVIFGCQSFFNIVSSERSDGTVGIRFEDICRSHSIWLDPVDSPKELYKWRLRVQRTLDWAYLNDCIPIMMTLTIFHRWHPLKRLIDVLKKSWEKLLVAGRPAKQRKEDMGLVGYIRRLEITLNDGTTTDATITDATTTDATTTDATTTDATTTKREPMTNAGWHPHYHVILFVQKDKLKSISEMEPQLKKEWVSIVCQKFFAEFGERIDPSYIPSFDVHGLYFSRYAEGDNAGELRQIRDSKYLDKIEGYDHSRIFNMAKELYGSSVKNSKIPFDLLREVTSANIDLWTEYAIATKGLSAFRFARPFVARVNKFYDKHPELDPSFGHELPESNIVAHLNIEIERLFYRNCLLPMLKKKAAEGYDALLEWVKQKYVEWGIPELCDDPDSLPQRPDKLDCFRQRISSRNLFKKKAKGAQDVSGSRGAEEERAQPPPRAAEKKFSLNIYNYDKDGNVKMLSPEDLPEELDAINRKRDRILKLFGRKNLHFVKLSRTAKKISVKSESFRRFVVISRYAHKDTESDTESPNMSTKQESDFGVLEPELILESDFIELESIFKSIAADIQEMVDKFESEAPTLTAKFESLLNEAVANEDVAQDMENSLYEMKDEDEDEDEDEAKARINELKAKILGVQQVKKFDLEEISRALMILKKAKSGLRIVKSTSKSKIYSLKDTKSSFTSLLNKIKELESVFQAKDHDLEKVFSKKGTLDEVVNLRNEAKVLSVCFKSAKSSFQEMESLFKDVQSNVSAMDCEFKRVYYEYLLDNSELRSIEAEMQQMESESDDS